MPRLPPQPPPSALQLSSLCGPPHTSAAPPHTSAAAGDEPLAPADEAAMLAGHCIAHDLKRLLHPQAVLNRRVFDSKVRAEGQCGGERWSFHR